LGLLIAFQAMAQDTSTGRELYQKYVCYACHSAENAQGPPLIPMKLRLPEFIARVRKPRRMPAYSRKNLPDARLALIYEYLKTAP
jgi:mono/diheme cytochrome c family protein